MRLPPFAALAFLVGVCLSSISASEPGTLLVWPLPLREAASGAPLALATNFTVRYSGASKVAAQAAERYTDLVRRKLLRHDKLVSPRAVSESALLSELVLLLDSDEDALRNWRVNESYSLQVANGAATTVAATPFGGLRALETFYQLVQTTQGTACLPHDAISIIDSPTYNHRSLLIDMGRRLYPVIFVKSIVDAMSYSKLNVLHLHMNDMGRFSIESKIYPELNVGYCIQGSCDGTYWTQEELKDLISYSRLRGVRVVPELEMSTHARALLPLVKSHGLSFCNSTFPVLLYDDPAGVTFGILKTLLEEVVGLFEDEVVHVGMDEAQCHYSEPASKDPLDIGMCGLQAPTPMCNYQTVRSLQHKMIQFAASLSSPSRGVRPMVWHNAFTDCGDLGGCAFPEPVPPSVAGISSTIVEVFAGALIGTDKFDGPALLKNVTASGYNAVMADAARLYLDTGSPDPAAYYKAMWYDIGDGLTVAERLNLMGGSLSLWSDSYCSGQVECGGWAYCPNGQPANTCVSGVGWMQSSDQDAAFVLSAGGLLFPRATIGAGAFWHYSAELAYNSTEMRSRTQALAASMEERGVMGLCPGSCTCSFGSRCGQPYKEGTTSTDPLIV